MKIIQDINKKALKVAMVSLLLGTTILTLYFITNSAPILIGGVFYLFIAFVLNTMVFIELLANAVINYQQSKENLITILLFLINVPIGLGYALAVINNPI